MDEKHTRRWPMIFLLLLSLTVMAVSGWLWYDTSVDRSGWAEREGTRYYRDFYGEPASGWLTLEEGRYYLDTAGVPVTGWQTLQRQRYYFDENGVLVTGWQLLDGQTYYFGTDGIMVTGWLDWEGARYYLDDGRRVTGWKEVEGTRRYFGEDGAICQGFAVVDGEVYYFQEDGAYLSGEQELQGLYYLFREDGTMVTGWHETDQGRRFYYDDGVMAYGWVEADGKRYCFDSDGYAMTGWHQEGEYRYFFQEDGAAAVGPATIDGQLHYFTPKGIEVILVNRDHPVPTYYQLDLVTVTQWHQVDKRCYEALTRMLEDCSEAGIEYIFNSGYRTLKEQTMILETRTQEHMKEFELDYEEAREKALQTVAIPGTSEHHLGLAVDLLGEQAIAWLTEHCWEYGFIVRYTEEKEPITGIIDEPWHFRYVGRLVSLDMKDSGLCLEEYLGAA